MKKTIVACMALAYAGLAFSEPAILTEAKNYKLSNGQTMEQALANYSHCDQKEWGVVDNRAIFVCRDQEYTKFISEVYDAIVDESFDMNNEQIENFAKRLGISKEAYIKNLEDSKKNPRVHLARSIDIANKNNKLTEFAGSALGVSGNEAYESLLHTLTALNATSTKEDFFVIYFDRENGNVVANYANMHYWIDVNGKVNYKGLTPAEGNSENRIINNISYKKVPLSEEESANFALTLMEAYAQAEAKAKKESSK